MSAGIDRRTMLGRLGAAVAGIDRMRVLHRGAAQPGYGAPAELNPTSPRDDGYRVPPRERSPSPAATIDPCSWSRPALEPVT